MHVRWFLAILCLVTPALTFNLTLLHTNDAHARYDQTSRFSGPCSEADAKENKCYGGFPRLYTKIEEVRASKQNTVLVDGGDQFQGTIWFFKYGSNITSHFMNQLRYDVMAVGNHEFDLGPSELERFAHEINFTLVSSNIDASAYPDLQDRIQRSLVLNVSGQLVGFVGYTTTTTVNISNSGKVTFKDEVASVASEVEGLTSQGVRHIVCVGHAGYTKDLQIARDIPNVDVVVGGHTNTFLYTGSKPSNEEPVGDYPTVVRKTDGSTTLVVQSYAYTKYLGLLEIEFDDAGNVVGWSGNPILLNASVPRDPDLLAELEIWRLGVELLANETVGRTVVFLNGSSLACRQTECNLGNVIADAMVRQNLRHSDSLEWNHVAVSIVNSGAIRSSVQKGPITMADVLTVSPFRNSIDIVELNGSAILEVLEHSASQWDPEDLKGGFLQHSGLFVVYNMNAPLGQRVQDVTLRCADCQVPQMLPLQLAKVYKVVMSSFLAEGGDGYSMISRLAIKRHIIGDLDSEVLLEYVRNYSPIITGLEGRMRFHSTPTPQCPTASAPAVSATSLAAFWLLLALALWGPPSL